MGRSTLSLIACSLTSFAKPAQNIGYPGVWLHMRLTCRHACNANHSAVEVVYSEEAGHRLDHADHMASCKIGTWWVGKAARGTHHLCATRHLIVPAVITNIFTVTLSQPFYVQLDCVWAQHHTM